MDPVHPYYVRLAERLMKELFGIDLWRLKPRYRNLMILIALDNENAGDQAVEVIIYDRWREIRRQIARDDKNKKRSG